MLPLKLGSVKIAWYFIQPSDAFWIKKRFEMDFKVCFLVQGAKSC